MIPALLAAQNPDGGWGAHPGSRSWTEPTAWALLALHTSDSDPVPLRRGVSWLRQAQLSDGGWASSPGIGDRCWVSAVVALLPEDLLGSDEHRRALVAVRAGAGALPDWTDRLRQWMLGAKPQQGPITQGWSWVPGTAPWLVPTALSVLALRKHAGASAENRILLEHAQNYLLERQCRDGGWNHGSTRALGYESSSYPETTGLALLALRGVRSAAVERGIDRAAQHARNCQTLEGAYWLRLAFYAHGRTAQVDAPKRSSADNREQALAMIVERCLAGEELLWKN